VFAIFSAALVVVMAQSSAAPDETIAKPIWIKRPTASQVGYAYPSAARHAGSPDGRGTIACDVNADGGLEGCFVYKEDPAGLGFGEAALKLARYFKMQPLNSAGRSVAGGTVTLPIVFRGR
jgi:protein TonB